MIKLNGIAITPMIFPDRTSQVWKLPEAYFALDKNVILWEFEHEAEFLHVAQLKDLLAGRGVVYLDLPYLPYARQDKTISNETTFAFSTFAKLLNVLEFDMVHVFDPHNFEFAKAAIKNLVYDVPNPDPLLAELNAYIVFPDSGAAHRYDAKNYAHCVICTKDRDPLTGTINGIVIACGTVEPRPYLIVDDICDGGRTFIEVAKKLYEAGAKEVHLYVSHGIFSKGLGVLRDAGIKRIFTRNGEVDAKIIV